MDSSQSTRHIKIGHISVGEKAIVEKIMEDQDIDYDTIHRNCQDYVLEALGTLCDECLIEDDDEYNEAVDEAKEKYYGPQ